ncbi:MAG: nodulation outer protein NopM [Pseudomonadota bacterium]
MAAPNSGFTLFNPHPLSSNRLLDTFPPLLALVQQFGLANCCQHLALNSITTQYASGRLLPDALPASLRKLHLDFNQLTRLPDNLPASLRELHLFGNQLTCLPDNLPKRLTYLDVQSNPLSHLPENILTLLGRCSIWVDVSHLSETVRNRLASEMNAPGYRNIRI